MADVTELSDTEYRDLPEPRPHRFPDHDPSDGCYTRGCRCQLCRDAHARASRERQQAQRAGLWVDGRRAIRTHGFLTELVELAERYPEVHALLRKYGHVAPVIRLQAEPSEPANGGPEPVVQEHAALPGPSGNAPDNAAVTEPLSHSDALLKLAISKADKDGNLPAWLISATSIATEMRISVNEAQAALQKLWGVYMTMGAFGGPKLIRWT
jgi:hypothetical protein